MHSPTPVSNAATAIALPALSPDMHIAAKALGNAAGKNFCERCFWLEQVRGVKHEPSGDSDKGVLSSIAAFTKRVVHDLVPAALNRPRLRPLWLRRLEQHAGSSVTGLLPTQHAASFSFYDSEHRILLNGEPDDMFKLADGSIYIIDYKTARLTPYQKRLLPVYDMQLNAYALIANSLRREKSWGTVRGIALLYAEPQTDEPLAVKRHFGDSFALHFKASFHPLTLDLEKVRVLLAGLRALRDSKTAPSSHPLCRSCRRHEEEYAVRRAAAPSINAIH